jgi:hypothetical protein
MHLLHKFKRKLFFILKKALYYIHTSLFPLFKYFSLIQNDRTLYYLEFNYNFFKLPKIIKKHRFYFSKKNRGYGENAFHKMWEHIFKKYKPLNILEIGVYRGQTISLFLLLSDFFNLKSNVYGISPLENVGDSVSRYPNLDYREDILKNTRRFSSKNYLILDEFSTSSKSINFISSKKWDLIYIDGNHDYEVVKMDFNNCSNNLKIGGLLVLDDSSLFTNFIPPFYSNSGHPGPSKVADEIDLNTFKELLSVGHNRVFIKLK